MIMNTFTNVFLAISSSFFLTALGKPVDLGALDVYDSPVTYPQAGLYFHFPMG